MDVDRRGALAYPRSTDVVGVFLSKEGLIGNDKGRKKYESSFISFFLTSFLKAEYLVGENDGLGYEAR